MGGRRGPGGSTRGWGSANSSAIRWRGDWLSTRVAGSSARAQLRAGTGARRWGRRGDRRGAESDVARSGREHIVPPLADLRAWRGGASASSSLFPRRSGWTRARRASALGALASTGRVDRW